MSEQTDQIRAHFSGPEWERLGALGFDVPDDARAVIERYRAKHRRERGEQVVCILKSKRPPLALRIDGQRYPTVAAYARAKEIPYTTAIRKFNPCRAAKGVA